MFRWENVSSKTLNGMTVKMYREPLEYLETQPVINEGLELDHYAFKYLGSEALYYQILEVNFTEYIEARGKTERMKEVSIPIETREEII